MRVSLAITGKSRQAMVSVTAPVYGSRATSSRCTGQSRAISATVNGAPGPTGIPTLSGPYRPVATARSTASCTGMIAPPRTPTGSAASTGVERFTASTIAPERALA